MPGSMGDGMSAGPGIGDHGQLEPEHVYARPKDGETDEQFARRLLELILGTVEVPSEDE